MIAKARKERTAPQSQRVEVSTPSETACMHKGGVWKLRREAQPQQSAKQHPCKPQASSHKMQALSRPSTKNMTKNEKYGTCV